jgi:ribonucleoside-triphosphate reductase
MSSKVELEERLVALKSELASAEGTDTEVYSRIVGYYRAVRNWNAGKREEYAHRKVYSMPGEAALGEAPKVDASALRPASVQRELLEQVEERPAPASPEKSGILVFTRASCPNCPPVKDFVSRSGLAAVFVDVDKEEGVALARRHNVMATPTVVGIDAAGAESFRAYGLAELKDALAQSAAPSAAAC